MTKSLLAAVLAATIILGAATACGGGADGGAGGPRPSSTTPKPAGTFSVRFDTTRGPFVVKVNRSWAPLGAERFYNLVRSHFYDNQPIFRVVPGFVVQWGISGIPSVAKRWENATIKDDPVKHSNDRGTITFATGGPNTRTTQVFVNLAPNEFLDSQGFSPFGTVTDGFSIFRHLYSGYGDHFDQRALTEKGASWVRENFRKLDWIKTARLLN
jgi:peptidyl-prolyl cis-trans isomerase A (cyclophilin A)